MDDSGGVEVERALAHVYALADGPPVDRTLRITLHFHPEPLLEGRSVLAHLADDRRYRSQFETGMSNGGRTAFRGGDRWNWEHRIFGGAYDEATARRRPVYGALNHRRRPADGSIRFGSAHLRLVEATLDRATFCYPDSVFGPTDFGTAGRTGLTELADRDRRDLLDDYIEAQVHGPVRLPADVEAVVLDPSFRGTEIETVAAALAVPVEWHHGFRLPLAELRRHGDYRGRSVVELGERVAVDGWLDACIIGAAAATGRHPEQVVKQLWHCTARFGERAP